MRLELKTADAPTTGNGPDPSAAKESSSACHLSGPSMLLSAGMLLCIPPDGSMLRVRLRAHPMPGKKESDPRWLVAGESNLSAEEPPPCKVHPAAHFIRSDGHRWRMTIPAPRRRLVLLGSTWQSNRQAATACPRGRRKHPCKARPGPGPALVSPPPCALHASMAPAPPAMPLPPHQGFGDPSLPRLEPVQGDP